MRGISVAVAVSLLTGTVALGGTAIAAAVTPAAPAAPAQVPVAEWGNAIPVPMNITAISCPAAGDCAAAGTESEGVYGAQQGFVIEESGGKWGKPSPIPGLKKLNVGGLAKIDSISCPSPGNCSAGGYYATSPFNTPAGVTTAQAFVVTEKSGVWGAAEEVPGSGAANNKNGFAQVNSVSCAAAGECAAVGDIDPSSTAHDFIVNETGGNWGTLQPISGTVGDDQVDSVSCAAAGDCLAGGGYPDSASSAFLAQETDGTWGSAQPVAGLVSLSGTSAGSMVTAVSCPATGACAATGGFGARGEFVADESGGTWANAQAVTGMTGEYGWTNALSCASAGDCALAGAIYSASLNPSPYIASEAGGSWGPSNEIGGSATLASGVSCPAAGQCSVVGDYIPAGGRSVPYVADESAGIWGKAQAVPGAAQRLMYAVSCGSPLSCVAGGDGFLVEKSTARRTTLTLSVARPSVAYGDEQTEGVSVRVTADSGTPSGSVAVHAGSGTLCTIKLAAGRGGCVVPARRFTPGKVVLSATYGGAPGFTASVKATAAFTVARDVTKTTLRLSAGTVTFGRESSERLTVVVTPNFVRPVPGRVTVTAGTHVVCVIGLRHETGSCTLKARQLRAGTYTLTAHYPGSSLYAPSKSAPRKLTVRK